MTRLSVNINKIATLRNARGGNVPNVAQVATDCQRFGAHGITVHPRPDQRHIRYQDVLDLKQVVNTEFNIEGFPEKKFIDLVMKVEPQQVTLVPDPPDALTSNNGWDTRKQQDFLKEVISEFKTKNIRVSIFLNADPSMTEAAAKSGADRIELYTGPYAHNFITNAQQAIEPYVKTAEAAIKTGLEINAGHDLNLQNLQFFYENIPQLAEVSIGHALIADALYFGLHNTIQMYLNKLGFYAQHS
jgi:pyridoxine 5-phosphate synthase